MFRSVESGKTHFHRECGTRAESEQESNYDSLDRLQTLIYSQSLVIMSENSSNGLEFNEHKRFLFEGKS